MSKKGFALKWKEAIESQTTPEGKAAAYLSRAMCRESKVSAIMDIAAAYLLLGNKAQHDLLLGLLRRRRDYHETLATLKILANEILASIERKKG